MSKDVEVARRVGAYIRTSADGQSGDTSLASQERIVRDFCEQEPSLTLADLYIEKGESAFNDKCNVRPEFERLNRDVLEGRIQVIVTPSLDRLSRRATDVRGYVDLLEKPGVDIISLQPYVNTTARISGSYDENARR